MLSDREQLRLSGIAIAKLAEELDQQFAEMLSDWKARQYGDQDCVVPHDWNYLQGLMLQQVSINFLAKYQQGQGFVPNRYPTDRASGKRKVTEEEIDPNALLAIAHSEDIELWKELVAQVITSEPKSFHQICRLAQDLDWGKDSYSKAKVYLGILLSEGFEVIASEESFYQNFMVVDNGK